MSTNEAITGARTIWELVERRAEASPDRAMLIAPDDTEVTFGAFRARAERVAAGLQAMGVGEGSMVSWQLPTRIDTVVLSIALSASARSRTRSSTSTASARWDSPCARPGHPSSSSPRCGGTRLHRYRRQGPRWGDGPTPYPDH